MVRKYPRYPILNDIRGHSDLKIYARLQEMASNFSKFSGGGREAPQTPRWRSRLRARFGASPPYRAPLSKIPGSAAGQGVSKIPVDSFQCV